MRLLAIDAALGPCSVALVEQGRCLGQFDGGDSRSVTATLPAMAQRLLAAHGSRLDAVAVTVGPGSFTGLRGALALATGIALGAGVPVVGVTVAEALLEQAALPPGIAAWVALDSRRAGRIFLGRDGDMRATTLDALPPAPGSVLVLGDAAAPTVAALCQAGADAAVAFPQAVSVLAVTAVAWRRLAGELPPCPVQPLYVAPAEARTTAATRPAPA